MLINNWRKIMEIKSMIKEVEVVENDLVETEKFDSVSGGCFFGCIDFDLDIDFS